MIGIGSHELEEAGSNNKQEEIIKVEKSNDYGKKSQKVERLRSLKLEAWRYMMLHVKVILEV